MIACKSCSENKP